MQLIAYATLAFVLHVLQFLAIGGLKILLHSFQLEITSIITRVAAPSKVLRINKLSFGNIRFSDTCQTETRQSINIKVCTINFVGKVT
jgi:hypothetical protein